MCPGGKCPGGKCPGVSGVATGEGGHIHNIERVI